MFILDPVCAQLLGHNLTSLVKFRSYFSSFGYYSQIIPVASNLLPKAVATEQEVECHFQFYYHNRMKLAGADGKPVVDETSALPDYEERQLEAAQNDFSELFKKFSIGKEDSLFFPSVDFYAALGALGEIQRIPPNSAPRLYIRFIGVMEYACSLYSNPKRELLRQIKACIAKGYPVYLSAEAAVYADNLAFTMGEQFAATPVPPFHDYLELEDSDEFVVISPGSGRIDKGFNLLPDIISHFRRNYNDLNVRFVVQNLPMWDLEHNMGSASQLYAGPGVELLPASIGFNEMTQLFQSSHLVLMPYAADIYALRSSAILTESVGLGRQVVTSCGTGFESEVTYFNLGKACSNIAAYSKAIADYSRMPRRDLERTALQARHRYSSYCLSQYKEWLK